MSRGASTQFLFNLSSVHPKSPWHGSSCFVKFDDFFNDANKPQLINFTQINISFSNEKSTF